MGSCESPAGTRRRLIKQAAIGAGVLAVPAGLLPGRVGAAAAGGRISAGHDPARRFTRRVARRALGEVIIGSYGGTTEEARRAAFWDPFTERTGVEVVVVDIPGLLGNEMLAGSVPAEWDAFHTSPSEYLTGLELNDVEFPQVPEIAFEDLVPAEFQPYSWQSFFIAYVPAMLPGTYEGDQPMTWADFFDVEKFPGDRAWPSVDYYNGVFEAALLGDGVPPRRSTHSTSSGPRRRSARSGTTSSSTTRSLLRSSCCRRELLRWGWLPTACGQVSSATASTRRSSGQRRRSSPRTTR